MLGELLSPDSERWDLAVRKVPHDIYHLRQYCRLCETTDGGIARAFFASDGDCHFFAPLLLRRVPAEPALLDAISPYGYSGPVAGVEGRTGQALPPEFVRAAAACMIERLHAERVVCAFVRLHPLVGVDPAALEPWGAIAGSETVVIDLRQSPAELWSGTRDDHRRGINKALRAGWQVGAAPGWSELPGFIEAYRQTMRRTGAGDYYFFAPEYFNGLRDALGGHYHLLTVHQGGNLSCGAIFSEINGLVQYHLSATRDEFLAGQPMKLLLHWARLWFAARGNTAMNLGGGLHGGDDSLFLFKAGFSKLRRQFHTWRVVVDAPAYAGLVRQWEAAAGAAADDASGFFPAYRKRFPEHASR
jgi:hypothetical protein